MNVLDQNLENIKRAGNFESCELEMIEGGIFGISGFGRLVIEKQSLDRQVRTMIFPCLVHHLSASVDAAAWAKNILNGYKDGDIATAKVDGKTYTKVVSMQKLDSAGVDTVDLRQLVGGADEYSSIMAARTIQMLEPDDFDSLAQYLECVAGIAREFNL